MGRLFTPPHRPLTVPGSERRVLRRPDLRSLLAPARPSGAPLDPFEQDWDDLVIYRSWRVYEPDRPDEVRYFMYEFAQRDPGASEWWFGFKAVRLIRLTRVPRYLRASSSHAGPNLVFEQMRDVLAALREQQTLFVQMIAKSPQLPMVFAYGVQAVGASPEEAMAHADESYAVLAYQLAGTYQQLQYKPLTVEEGELIARYQVEWDNLAVARGRPLPTGGTLNTGALLTDARTDVESTNNQLESFIRGMSDKSFMLTMVTVPLSPAEMITAWRNITQKLSDARSDQDGTRSISAAVALPLEMGQSLGNTAGTTHTAGATAGHGTSTGLSHSLAQSVSHTQGTSTSHSNAAGVSTSTTRGQSLSQTHAMSASNTQGQSASQSHGVSASNTQGQSASQSHGVSASNTQGQSLSQTRGQSSSLTQGQSASVSQSQTQSQAATVTQGTSVGAAQSQGTSLSAGQSTATGQSSAAATSLSHTLGQSLAQTHGSSTGVAIGHNSSLSQGTTATEGHSVASGQNSSTNQSTTIGQSNSASTSGTQGLSRSQADSSGQSINVGSSNTNGISSSQGASTSSSVHGGVPGIGGSSTTGHSSSSGSSTSNGSSLGVTQSGSGTHTVGTSQSLTQGLSQSISNGASRGVSNGQSLTDTNNVGASQSLSATSGSSATQSAGLSSSLTGGVSSSNTAGQSLTQGTSLSQGASLTQGASESTTNSLSQSLSTGHTVGSASSVGASQGVSSASTQGVSSSSTQGSSIAATQGVSSASTQGASSASTQGVSAGVSQGVSSASTQGASSGVTQGSSLASTQGQSFTSTDTSGASQAASQGTTATAATSVGASAQQAQSDAYGVAMSQATATSSGLGVMPSVGISISRATHDVGKRVLGDVLEAQMLRYIDGYKSGAFLYQMFLVTPDRENLVGGSSLLKSAFWGAGGVADQVPQPFHVVDRFSQAAEEDSAERERLLAHARVFTSYRRREPSSELVEPFLYSSYITPSEASAFCHPPTAESLGIKAVWDSMPVFAMPHDRAQRDIKLGHIINGERAVVTDQVLGIDVDELTHSLIVGVTGSGKTTTLMRYLTDAARVRRTIALRPEPTSPVVVTKEVRASILGLDWMPNMRNLAAVVEPERFRFYSLLKPELGQFRWNLLAIPAETMTPTEWLNAQADNFTAAMSLGEYGRSLIAELLTDLYTANRLQPTTLLPDVVDPANGTVLRQGVVLPAVDPTTLPAGAIQTGPRGEDVANVMTCSALSRLVSMEHLAALVVAKVEQAATIEGARSAGTAMRDRIQSLWRRMSYYAPGGQFATMLGCDPDLRTKTCLTVTDLVDPDRGLVSIIETDGLDQANRRLILGSILMAVFRYGLAHGKGTFDHNDAGPGTFVVLEEAHELFREEKGEDAFTVATRNSLYESMFRRARALGLRLIAVAQNPGSLPEAVTSNTSTVFIHRIHATADRQVAASLLNWSNTMTGNLVEMRFLGQLPTGWCITRLEPKSSWLEAAPILMLTDPPAVREVSDQELARLAATR